MGSTFYCSNTEGGDCMKVGVVGCGKLGLMVALTIESKGHEVKGYDINPAVYGYLKNRRIPFKEEHSDELLSNTHMEMVGLQELCQWADIIFMAPQTPHDPRFEGAQPLPEDRADFDYSYLIECVKSVDKFLREPKTCVVISTVLPGTIEREIQPIISRNFKFVYSPQFIAMGTVYSDFMNPEFWLIGSENNDWVPVAELYRTICDCPIVQTDIKTAEGIKVFYNTFITAKTVLANLYGEMAHRLNMNVDDIYKAITLSTRRLISSRYLKAGMGDGGGCHPRDNIALSFVAKREGLSFDFFEALMTARENHCAWLADLCEQYANEWAMPIVILGQAFKPETNITTGSPSILLYNILFQRALRVLICDEPERYPAVYFIGCQHSRYASYSFPKGSVVIDPFRYIPSNDNYTVIRIGEKTTSMVTA